MATWPNASNTGVPEGVTLLPSGGLVITQAGVTISGLNITGTVYINADNVTLVNCRVTAASYSVVQIARGADGVVIKNCEIDGRGSNNDGSHGISGTGTFLANNIYNVENGINVVGSGAVIKDNYIHDLNASGSPHYDGIQVDGGNSNVTIEHNTIINQHGQTAAVMIDNYFGPISNITVNNNLLVGGGYTVYSDGQFTGGTISGVSVTNNHIGEGYWGATSFVKNNPVYTGNVMDGDAIASHLDDGVESPPATPTPPTAPSIPTINGTAGADDLVGTAAAEKISAGLGNDKITGGTGRDAMTGGAGSDIFIFKGVGDTGKTVATRDVITDFTHLQDKIDLSAIDAASTISGKQGFTLLPANDANFTNKAGELTWHTEAAQNRTIVQGDTNGDGVHDFEIELTGIVNLTAADFVGLAAATPLPTPTPVPLPPIVGPVGSLLNGTSGNNTLVGSAGADVINGLAGNDRLYGGAGDDKITGGAGNDWIPAGDGNDTITGGMGRDFLGGGSGRDIFVFQNAGETGRTVMTRDVITDFTSQQDKIDLSAIDANSKVAGNQAFTFLTADDASFTHKPGELAWRTEASLNRTIIQGDVNGDGVHDFEIQLTGVVQLKPADVVL